MNNENNKYKENLGVKWIIDNLEFYEYPLNPVYWITKTGIVYNAEKERIIAQSIIQSGKGYYTVALNCMRTRVHRMLAITFLNNPNNYPVVDHINTNSLDNSLENLRWATNSMNNRNLTKNKNKSSKYMGVNKCRNKWAANCLGNYLGVFATEELAALAYNNFAEKHNIQHLNKIENK